MFLARSSVRVGPRHGSVNLETVAARLRGRLMVHEGRARDYTTSLMEYIDGDAHAQAACY